MTNLGHGATPRRDPADRTIAPRDHVAGVIATKTRRAGAAQAQTFGPCPACKAEDALLVAYAWKCREAGWDNVPEEAVDVCAECAQRATSQVQHHRTNERRAERGLPPLDRLGRVLEDLGAAL